MGRPKKTVVAGEAPVGQVIGTLNDKVEGSTPERRVLRDQDGLLKNLEYKFKPTGFVDWRAMIPKEYLCLNREKFLKKENALDVDDLTEDEYAKLLANAKEQDILIKLAGLKELAQIRGYEDIRTHVFAVEGRIVAETRITWSRNFESPCVTTSGTADATPENTNGLAQRHLVAIAENRSFARAVRNFLQIHTVSQDEVKFENVELSEKSSPGTGPQAAIERKLKDAKSKFTELHEFIMDKYPDKFIGSEVWEKPSDVPPADANVILSKIFAEFLESKK